MAMNIIGPGTNQLPANKTRGAESMEASRANTGTDSAEEDGTVALSDRGRVLEALESRISNIPEIDQEKVDRIRNAISNGEYQIDHEKLAAAFQRFESEL